MRAVPCTTSARRAWGREKRSTSGRQRCRCLLKEPSRHCAQRGASSTGAGAEFDSVEDVTRAAHGGHPVALAAIERWRARLVDALVAMAHAHGPEVIVVGGGPMVADTPLLVGVEQHMAARLFPGLTVRLRRAELGDAAALVGVAHLARRALGDD